MVRRAVEPENAAILSGGTIGSHIQMGIGDGLIPQNLNQQIYDQVCVISDQEAIDTAKALARQEGILCGISSGTNVAAALRPIRRNGTFPPPSLKGNEEKRQRILTRCLFSFYSSSCHSR